MNEMLKRMEFRPCSYEDDTEPLVDMHRCFETLEGGWFDGSETFRMHFKMVARTPGSSWVIGVGRAVFGYADLLRLPDGNGIVPRWRLHPDFHHPVVAGKLISGLKTEALKRSLSGLVLLGDTSETTSDLESVGIKRDRCYRPLKIEGTEQPSEAEIESWSPASGELEEEGFQPFLGLPLPPAFVTTRASMAAEYGVFRFRRPSFFRIRVGESEYLGCFDGNDWYVFRKRKSEQDARSVIPILSALGSVEPGKIMLSEAALKAAGREASGTAAVWDHFTPAAG